jgi:hypothetical protein
MDKIHKLTQKITTNPLYILLIVLVISGAILRFNNLNWDGKYFFHPDERNVVDAIHRIDYSGCIESIFHVQTKKHCELNPDFFAYGTFPIYVTKFFSDQNYDRTYVVIRAESAILSTLLIPLTFLITRHIIRSPYKNRIALIAAFFVTFSPGMIQFAHFGTFETFLTFEYVLLAYSLLKYLETKYAKWFYLAAIITGLSIATKVVSLALLPVLLIVRLVAFYYTNREQVMPIWKRLYRLVKEESLNAVLLVIATILITAPFMLLDFKAFKGSMDYEGPVANGALLVFYTQQFIGTIPVLYQFTKVFPYILSPFLTLAFIPAFFATIIRQIRLMWKFRLKDANHFGELVILLIVLAYSIFHLSLYVKWTRYMIPLVPFMIILICIGLNSILIATRAHNRIKFSLLTIIIIALFTYLFSGLDFSRRYFNVDAHITASEWVKDNVPADKLVLVEPMDLGAIPFNEAHSGHVNELNVYDLDNNQQSYVNEFYKKIDSADYIIILANRVYPLRYRLAEKYPLGYKFFQSLNDGTLGFRQVAAFDRVNGFIDAKIDLEKASQEPRPDETFNVFDNPQIIIYQKNSTQNDK